VVVSGKPQVYVATRDRARFRFLEEKSIVLTEVPHEADLIIFDLGSDLDDLQFLTARYPTVQDPGLVEIVPVALGEEGSGEARKHESSESWRILCKVRGADPNVIVGEEALVRHLQHHAPTISKLRAVARWAAELALHRTGQPQSWG
jgi:hypothetical protein